jgi:hypothetical protein
MFRIVYKDAALTDIRPFWNDAAVERMSWDARGGPRMATLSTAVTKDTAGAMLSMAGMRLWIDDDQAERTWWGYAASISVTVGGITFAASMDGLANRVALKYTYQEAGSNTLGEAKTTAWADDADSQALFGVKELLVEANLMMTDTGATERRDTELAWRKLLHARATLNGGGRQDADEDAVTVTIECRGFMDMTNWRYTSWPAVVGPSYTATSATEQAVGAASSASKVVQQVTVGTGAINVLQVAVYARKQGTPADNLRVGLYALDGSGNPTGSALASWTLAGGSVGASLAWITQSVTEVELAANTQYGLQVDRSGAVDAANYYVVGVNTALGYTGGVLKIWNGSAWVARGTDADLCFQLLVNDKVETSAQISDLMTNFGPSLIAGQLIEIDSGVYLRSFRDGNTTALEEILELLESGTVNTRRMLCEITAGRIFHLWEEPDPATVEYYLDSSGNQGKAGAGAIPAHRPVVGVYARMTDVLPGASTSARLSDPTVQFIESAEWSGGSVRFSFRGE